MNELTTKNDFSNLPCTLISPAELKRIAQPTEYLARIQLFTKGKAIDEGLIKPGHYGIPQTGGDDVTDLGAEIDVMVFALRPKAMDVTDVNNIRVCYDINDPLYEEITSMSEGGLYGPSFLVYERSTQAFYELFFCNKSARKVAPALYPFLPINAAAASELGCEPHGPLTATLGVRYATGAKGKWHTYTVKNCSVPFSTEPTVEDAVEQITKFLNPEVAEEDTRGRAR